MPVTVVVAANRMVDADLARAWCGRWAGWWWRHGRHEIVKHHPRAWSYTNKPNISARKFEPPSSLVARSWPQRSSRDASLVIVVVAAIAANPRDSVIGRHPN